MSGYLKNKLYWIGYLSMAVYLHVVAQNTYVLDTIKAEVYTKEGVDIVTQSDLELPSLHGGERGIQDLIFESLVFMDAKKHKMEPDDEAVDRYLADIMEKNSIGINELEDIFLQAGRSLKDGRMELRKMQAVSSMLDFKIRSNIVVSKKDIQDFYAAYPEYEEPQFKIRYSFVAFDGTCAKEEQKKQLQESIRARKVDMTKFGNPFWIAQKDLALDKQFIATMKKGQTAVHQADEGFELYFLQDTKEKRLKTMQERYREISAMLTQPKYTQMLQSYRSQLFKDAAIVYYDGQ